MKEIKYYCGDEADSDEENAWGDEAAKDWEEKQDEEDYNERNDFNDYSDDDIENIFRD